MDPQQSDPEGRRELSDHAGAEGLSENAEDPEQVREKPESAGYKCHTRPDSIQRENAKVINENLSKSSMKTC